MDILLSSSPESPLREDGDVDEREGRTLLLVQVESGQNPGNGRHKATVNKHDHLPRAPAMSLGLWKH